jgi:hypothetical protein
MEVLNYISLLFILIAGVAKGSMDELTFHYRKSIFAKFNPKWWNPGLSWRNKYVHTDDMITTLKPRFFGSTSFLSFTTDAWHFFQFIYLTMIGLSIVFYVPITQWWYVDFIILRFALWIGFILIYKDYTKKFNFK